MTRYHDNAEDVAAAIIDTVGKRLVVGLPVGIGKAIHVVDALFERALVDKSLSLTIFTGLTLVRPTTKKGLESRLAAPIIERLFGEWPTPKYADALARQQLPDNIEVREFYLRPGAYLGNSMVQRSYTSINYSQVVAELLNLGVNVIAQLVAADESQSERLSLSSNPELTLDLLDALESAAQQNGNRRFAMVGQINENLPFMPGEAAVDLERFDVVLKSDKLQFPLFGLPAKRVTAGDYATGMHVASLIPDGGTLQLGIGSLSDAVAHCLHLRNTQPEIFRSVLEQLPGGSRSPVRKTLPIEIAPFEEGLFAATELMSDALFSLFERNIIRRQADDIDASCVHAGFFVGSSKLYDALRQLPEERRNSIRMTRISAVNTLFGNEAQKRKQRRDARFVNETMMVTLLGAAVSDSLDEGRVVSGVGGQFDFVKMAHALNGAQSILMLRANRVHKGKTTSNIRWSYPHATVPRHYRDVYVSEYGVAATRGKSDQDVIDLMLQISGSDFQHGLLANAMRARKLTKDYRIPDHATTNTPSRLAGVFNDESLREWFPPYPMGTQLTPVEQTLVVALEWLQQRTATTGSLIRTATETVFAGNAGQADSTLVKDALERMQLNRPSTIRERLERRLVRAAILETNNSQ